MKEWYSAQELAGIPGLPGTVRGITKTAIRLHWPSRKRQGRGGGREYHINAFPGETRAHLERQPREKAAAEAALVGEQAGRKLKFAEDIEASLNQARQAENLTAVTALTTRQQNRMDARLAILKAIQGCVAGSDHTPGKALTQCLLDYDNGSLEVPPWARELYPRVSDSTVQRWRHALRTLGAVRLAGLYGNRRGQNLIDNQQELKRLAEAMLTQYPHTSASKVLTVIQHRFEGRQDIRIPQPRTVERWMNQWKQTHKQLYLAISNPDAHKNKHMTAFGQAAEDVIRLNQRWELDSTPADVDLKDGRHALLGVIDVYSRRAKIHVAKTSTAAGIAHLIRRAILDWGVPETVKTDNGQDYISRHLQRVFQSLDIDQKVSAPFAPWEKPHIERFFKSFAHDMVELMPNYIGHNVADREALRARQTFAERLFQKNTPVAISMTADELQTFVDRWCESIYTHRSHQGLDGRTPFVQAASWTEPVRRIANERAMDILLLPAPDGDGWRTVTKKGLRVDRYEYVAPELGDEDIMGTRVRVLYDPEDMGRVYVFGGTDIRFICIAECPELTGLSRQQVAVEAKTRQRQRLQAAKKEMKKAARKENLQEVVDELLTRREAEAQKIVHFPQKTENHTSPGLDAAEDALLAPENYNRGTTEVSIEQWAKIDRDLEQSAAQGRVHQEHDFESPFARAFWIYEELLKDREVTPEHMHYLSWYRETQPRKSVRNLDDLLTAKWGDRFIALKRRLAQ